MKLATCVVLTFLLCCTGTALAAPATTSDFVDLNQLALEKEQAATGVPVPGSNVGGEDIASAVPIPGLPFSDGGNTCTYLNDYDEVCPFSGGTAPDVVYSLSPSADTEIDISLCNSSYDTKVYVYENAPTTLVACNDDACGSDGFRSELTCVPLTAGNTYYIVVDGYSTDCGTYDLQVSECVPCIVNCPTGSIAEGETDCADNYNDTFNGGCNSTPNVFSNLPCAGTGLTVCGRYGGFLYSGLSYRDTDWYQIDVPAGGFANVSICVEGEHPTLMGYLDGNLGCGSPAFVDFTTVGPCMPGCINVNLPPGPAWVFVATDGFGTDFPCGADYTLTIDGLNCPVSVEPSSWAEIKAQYDE